MIVLRLRDEALEILGSLRVGDYVTADGEKDTEELYCVDELEIDNQ